MANSRFQYVREFEEHAVCLRGTFVVVRLDGRGFTKFCARHGFAKPNDARAAQLMNRCALEVCRQFPEIFLAFGESDEFSFAFRRDTGAFGRRREKLLSTTVSIFSAAYVFHWPACLGALTPLQEIPQFDGRIVLYPR